MNFSQRDTHPLHRVEHQFLKTVFDKRNKIVHLETCGLMAPDLRQWMLKTWKFVFEITTSFFRRFDPTYRRAEQLVRQEVGTIQTMHAVYADAPTPPLYFLQANREYE